MGYVYNSFKEQDKNKYQVRGTVNITCFPCFILYISLLFFKRTVSAFQCRRAFRIRRWSPYTYFANCILDTNIHFTAYTVDKQLEKSDF